MKITDKSAEILAIEREIAGIHEQRAVLMDDIVALMKKRDIIIASQFGVQIGDTLISERASDYGKEILVTGWRSFDGSSLYVYGRRRRRDGEWGKAIYGWSNKWRKAT